MPLLFNLLHLGQEDVEDLGDFLTCATGIEVSTKNGDAMVTKNLERLSSFEPGHMVLPGQFFMPPPAPEPHVHGPGCEHHHH